MSYTSDVSICPYFCYPPYIIEEKDASTTERVNSLSSEDFFESYKDKEVVKSLINRKDLQVLTNRFAKEVPIKISPNENAEGRAKQLQTIAELSERMSNFYAEHNLK